ncbi:hypothetical protein OAE12_00045 [bacterium]|nr:hypothetical protein [bacterium]
MFLNKTLPLFLLLLSTISWSQSTDLDKSPFSVNYVRLPEKPILEDSNRTFSVKSLNSEVLTQSFSQHYFESEIKVDGFTKLDNDAFITVESKLIDVTIISNDVSREEKSSTDKEGKVRKWSVYQAVINYRTEGTITVSSIDNSINEVFKFNRENTIKSKVEDTYKAADYFRDKNNIKSLRIDFVKNAIYQVNQKLNTLIGYSSITKKDNLMILDSKKHPEYANHQENFTLVKEAFAKMKSNEPIDAIAKEVQPAIDYFESVIPKYPDDKRKSRKLKYASLYNNAIIYYYLDQPEKSLAYAEKIIANDISKADAKFITTRAETLLQRFKDNQLKTRHMEVLTEDKSDFQNLVAQSNGASEEVFDPANDDDYSLSYIMTLAGDTIPAYVNVATINSLSTKLKGYVKDLEGKQVPRNFGASEVEMVVLGNGEKRYTVTFNEAQEALTASSFKKAGKKFVKRVYTSKTIDLYSYQNKELVILKKSSGKGNSTSSSGWAMSFRKKLAGLLDGECAALADRVKQKEFSNNQDSLIEFIKAYNTCKQ